MNEKTVREHAQRHARMLQSGDLPSAFSDLTDDAKIQLEAYVMNFPSPVERAEMVALAQRPEGYLVSFDVSGGGRELRLETTWADIEGHPMIVDVRGTGEG